MTIILFILYALLWAAYEVSHKRDWRIYIFNRKYQLFHTFKFILNLYILSGLCFLPIPENLFKFILEAATIFWIVFDISYNLLNKQKWYHIGSGFIDNLGYWQFPIKLGLIVLIFVL